MASTSTGRGRRPGSRSTTAGSNSPSCTTTPSTSWAAYAGQREHQLRRRSRRLRSVRVGQCGFVHATVRGRLASATGRLQHPRAGIPDPRERAPATRGRCRRALRREPHSRTREHDGAGRRTAAIASRAAHGGGPRHDVGQSGASARPGGHCVLPRVCTTTRPALTPASVPVRACSRAPGGTASIPDTRSSRYATGPATTRTSTTSAARVAQGSCTGPSMTPGGANTGPWSSRSRR